jgi:RimJ/RimL family protein N-acetyltransferase
MRRGQERNDRDSSLAPLHNDRDSICLQVPKGVRTLDDARDYILKNPVAMYERLGFGLYLTELKGTGLPIGICGLIKRDALEDVDLGFALLHQFRGKGYAYESASAVMEYGRRTFGLNRIVAIASSGNYDSAKLLEKLGFSFESIVKLSDDSESVSLFAFKFNG